MYTERSLSSESGSYKDVVAREFCPSLSTWRKGRLMEGNKPTLNSSGLERIIVDIVDILGADFRPGHITNTWCGES